jgi:hypothetical protein
MGLENASYVEIDDADPEGTHLWVTVNDADGSVIELIEQYPLANRVGAYAMARRLAKLPGSRDREAQSYLPQVTHDAILGGPVRLRL